MTQDAPLPDPTVKQEGAGKTARIPTTVVPATEVLRKPDWIRVRAAAPGSRLHD
ncbi:MAG: lipoyl synthase, partial [Burkholderiales bacterium]|nr:lipoyl synthase [Burkholderiales bacterium]